MPRLRIQLGWEHGLSKKVPQKGRAITKAQVKAKREPLEKRLANESHRSRHGPKFIEMASEVFQFDANLLDANPHQQHRVLALVSTAVDHSGEDVDRKLGEKVSQGARQGGRKRSNEHAQQRELWQAMAEDSGQGTLLSPKQP